MTGVQTASRLIREQLAMGVWHSGQRLPPLDALARRCNVSRTTMWRAVAILQKASLLHARKGGAIIAGRPGMAHPSPDGNGLLWERIKVRAGRDIHQGFFAEKPLPLISKLSLHYGVTTRTLRKALDALVDEGLLASKGRTYVQVRGRSPLRRSTIAFVNTGTREGGINAIDPRSRALVESLERECFQRGYASRLVSFDGQRAGGVLDATAELKRIPDAAGFIVNIWNPWFDEYWQRWIDLLTFLVGRRVPVIVIDQSGDLVFGAPLLESRNFRVLRISSERSGEMVAEVLLRTGCHRAAYLTPFFNSPWARARNAGLVRHVRQYGPRASKVELFAFDRIADQNDLIIPLLGLDAGELRTLYREHLHNEQIAGLVRTLGKNRETGFPAKEARAVNTIRILARSLTDLAERSHDPALYESMFERFLKIAGDRAVALHLRPLFERALKSAGTSAWVCSDEKTALAALSFLSEHGKRVPEDISIISFDNWRESYEHQLTTYDFNMNGMVQEALLMITDETALRNRPVVSEVHGYVVERRSTRR